MPKTRGANADRVDTNKIAYGIRKHASEAANEEELKIRVESTLRPILEKWGIRWASYEHRQEISGRMDALYGRVVVEYKSPGKLANKTEFKKAKEQVKNYIKEGAGREANYGRFFGIILDGENIAFVRYRKGVWEEPGEPLRVNGQTVLRVFAAIRGLNRKPIDAEYLLLDFGPRSETSKTTILTLYERLAGRTSARTEMLFNDWKRVFSQVCSYSPGKLSGLVDYYGVGRKADVERLLFAVHTYYTLLMKLLTSEIVTLFADSLLGSYLGRLEEAYSRSHEEMLQELKDLEEGGIFADVGIRNFLEADYFAWYLDEWNEKVGEAVYDMTQALLQYEPATVELNPERVKDLFKRLYQNLVPRDIRHSIGEYFTPDWLAELLLDEIGYDGNITKKLLDPACGSGTFLVLAIKRIREYAEENFLDKRELVKQIILNVRGIDLNPLAVLAAKANYLIAMSDLIRSRPKEGIEIPIYLADSISVVRRMTVYGEDEYGLHTNEGEFWITKEVIDKDLLYPVLSEVTESVKLGRSKEEFEEIPERRFGLRSESVRSLVRLYDKILGLERKGKNRIWTSLLKNSFSPLLFGKFDFVVGNPPWINWESLPEAYRKSTTQLWNDYGLLEKTKGAGMGKVSRDIAMLFVARCMDTYVNDTGKLAFLVPFTTYKTQAGAGFRGYLANNTSIKRIHDLVELYPFEGAVNRTSLLVAEKGKTSFPVPCTMWSGSSSGGVPQEMELTEVTEKNQRHDMVFTPIRQTDPKTPWMITTASALQGIQKMTGESQYDAYRGIYSGVTSVFWVKIVSQRPLIIENSVTTGKIRSKVIRAPAEPGLLYPLLRGRDVKKWYQKSGFVQ